MGAAPARSLQLACMCEFVLFVYHDYDKVTVECVIDAFKDIRMYLFYVDESGEREYTSEGRYFVLTSLGVQARDWKPINNDVLTLKRTYFGSVDMEIKSNWLRIPKERQQRYLLPYRVTEAELKAFTDKLYDVVLAYDVTLIASVIDKRQMRQRYSSPQSPSSLAYRLLFERIDMFLSKQVTDEYGIVIFDKISELEIQKRGYEDLLSRQHLRYLEKGTDFSPINHIVEGLLFIPSFENNLLQLVDLCGYNVYRQFTAHGDEWDQYHKFLNRYPYFELIEAKLDHRPTGEYANWGIKKFP